MAVGALNELMAAQAEANKANELRYQQGMAIYDEIINRYQPGGTFGKAALGQLEKQKVRDVGAETQQLISSGLYGTTTAGGTGRRWEESVGAPARLRLEDIMMERLSQAQVGKAGFIERREDVGPGLGTIADLAAGIGQGQTGGGATFAGPSPSFTSADLLARYQKSYEQFKAEQGTKGGVHTPPITGKSKPTSTTQPTSTGTKIPMISALGVKQMRDPTLGGLWQKDTSAYKTYQETLAKTQPGSVTATGQEFSKIQEELRKKYGSAGAWQ